MKSMTGFGRSSLRNSGDAATRIPELDISIRAVNGRYLEMRFHLPREYAGLESDFKGILQKTFTRGTIDIYVNRAGSTRSAEVVPNSQLAGEYLAAYQKLGQDLKLEATARLEWLARIPEVLAVREHSELTEEEATAAKALVHQVAQACDSERIREGKALKLELERHLTALEDLSKQFEILKTEANSELEKRFRDRLAQAMQKFGVGAPGGGLGGGLAVDEQRLAQEIVMQLDRADVSEELQRLKEHIKAYRDLLNKSEPQGKKLDFYAQELLREVNTIGSKSHIAKLTSLVVEAKTLVERIREQVQNAE
ncbi:MAG: YicC family protein [Proteobacteria bacterium]|nr:MAG: YicC family protein [Pseudomonadota bacterium]